MIPLLLLFLLPLPLLSGGEQAIYAEVTCTMVTYSPYYDCSEPLFIIIWDMKHPPIYNATSDTFSLQVEDEDKALAYAHMDVYNEHTDNFAYFNVMNFGNWYAKEGIGTYDDPTDTVLWHEIKHILCKCAWHER